MNEKQNRVKENARKIRKGNIKERQKEPTDKNK